MRTSQYAEFNSDVPNVRQNILKIEVIELNLEKIILFQILDFDHYLKVILFTSVLRNNHQTDRILKLIYVASVLHDVLRYSIHKTAFL